MAFAFASLLAPAASAERSVLGNFELKSPFAPNGSLLIFNGTPVPLNASSGLPTAGDLYASGSTSCGLGCAGIFGATVSFAGGFGRELAPDGSHKLLWGSDTVFTGPDDADETQAVRVSATAGTFTLTFSGKTTAPIGFGASASTVESDLNALSTIASGGGSVSVTGGPGNAGGTAPYIVTFGGGPLHGTDQPLMSADSSSLTGTTSVYTTNPGHTGFEICDASKGDSCQPPKDIGSDGLTFSKSGARPGGIGEIAQRLALNQTTGDVYIYTDLRRINRYSATGHFLSAFGMDTVRQGPDDSTKNEIQELNVEAASGSYTLSLFVANEGTETTQALPYNATPAQIETALEELPQIKTYGGSVSVTGSNPYQVTFDGASGGDNFDEMEVSPFSAGRVKTLQDGGGPEVCTPKDECKQGETISFFNAPEAGQITQAAAIPDRFGGDMTVAPAGAPNEGNVLVSSGPDISEFSANGDFLGSFGWDVIRSGPGEVSSPDEKQQVTVTADGGTFRLGLGFNQTSSIPYNATPAEVKTALEKLPPIGGVGGSVSVTGGPGDLTGASPYVITFGGTLAGDDVPQMSAEGSGLTISAGTKSATVETLVGGGAFEVCKVAEGDICGGGTIGSGLGQFNVSDVDGITEGADGAIYTVEIEGSHRVQQFTPDGSGGLIPSLFGVEEKQEVNVNASAGQFRLSVGGDTQGAIGTGDTTAGSKVITNVNTTTGEFKVGRPIEALGNFTGFYATAVITEVGANTITVSAGAQSTLTNATLRSYLPYTTPNLAFNAPASGAGSVEEALNALPSISGDGSSVTVTGGPGNAGGTNPYVIAFHGSVPRTDFPNAVASNGTTPLSGGSGPGANKATVTVSDGGPNGRSGDDAPQSVGVLPNGDVVVAKRYPAMAAQCPAGFPIELSIPITRFQEFTPDGQTLVDSSPACNVEPDYLFEEAKPGFPFLEGSAQEVDASVGSIDPETGEIYSRSGVWGEVGTDPELTVNPVSGVTNAGATISGAIDPNGPGVINHTNPSVTRYAVDYRKVGAANWTRYITRVPVGSGSSPVAFSVGLSGLEPRTEYEARVLTVKPYGFSPLVRTTAPFTTLAGKPKIDSPFSENVTANSVDLHAAVNPSGAETTYRFEYGTTLAYGKSTPAISVGEGAVPVPVQAHIEGLEPIVYHFRVVATNTEGTTTSPDQTFNFYPESCPNSAAREQTGATRLPDCRAYELVSPARMGTVSLVAAGPPATYASGPTRFAYQGVLGTVPGPWNPPNGLFTGDTYVATRTPSGWQTHYVGVQANDLGSGEAVTGDLGLDTFLQRSLNTEKTGPSSAPYVFDAEGNKTGRLPTNLSEIPGGDASNEAGGFIGAERLSGDGSNFYYSSANVPLAPGGVTTGAGSVYRNDIANETVEVVSKTESGANIPPAPGAANVGHFLLLPAVSRDGSHILMAAPAGCLSITPMSVPCEPNPAVLYMRVNGATSYDVSEGHVVTFEGMTADGSKVFFTSAEQLTSDDHDTSVDLYMWSEATNSLTRVSAAADPVGNTDGCNTTWTSGCSVEVADGETVNNFFSESGATDNVVSANTGTIYFFSPEQLVGSEGFPGRRNLYAYRNEELDFVASLEGENPITRIQVSPDGRFAAFITRSRLTSYDNTGPGNACVSVTFGNPTSPQCEEMYLYDADTNNLVCASCDPTGAPPLHNVEASKNGIFLSNNGRAFFATKDPLVRADTDGLVDVYEYVQSRAQLITTGTAAQEQESSGFGALGSGLVGISADGTDVYIATLETLTAQDENGPFLKFYDARSDGGFPVSAQVQPCAAADECHGVGSSGPSLPKLSSTVGLGEMGNVQPGGCDAPEQAAKKDASRARDLFAEARQGAQHPDQAAANRAAHLRRAARRWTERAKKARTKAAHCRAAQRPAGTDRRTGK
jgi:hypothetical protein